MTHFDNNAITLSEPKDGKLGMKFYNIFSQDGPPCLKVEAKILFEPSVYNGTGDEPRKNIVLEITEDDAKTLEDLEQTMRIRTGISAEKWNSCVKRVDGTRLKAKINMMGPRQCEFLGPNGEATPPESLRNRAATAAILVRGIYMQRQASGLMVDVVALKYGEAEEKKTKYHAMLM